jgi:DNA modification methylase
VNGELLVGDCVELMRGMPDESVDAVCTDPPYGLEFMGAEWDKLGRSGVQRKAEVGGGDRRAIVDAEEWGGGESSPYSRSRVRWQHGDEGPAAMQEWHTVWAREAFRVLKPGGHLLAFGGTRTYHRLACAVEDAGFEVRDMIEWFYGSGFPKSLDVSKAIDKAARGAPQGGPDPESPAHGRYRSSATEGKRGEGDRGQGYGAGPGQFMLPEDEIDEATGRRIVGQKWADRYPNGPGGSSFGVGGEGPDGTRTAARTLVTEPATPEAARWEGWGTALKPGHEPIVLARKPLAGTVTANVLEYGTGALNVEGCRLEGQKDVPASPRRAAQGAAYGDLSNSSGDEPGFDPSVGRWPPNVALTHHFMCELVGCKVVAGTGHFNSTSVPSPFMANGFDEPGRERDMRLQEVEDWDCHPDCPVRQLDEQTGELPPGWAGPEAGGIGAGLVYGRGRPEGDYRGGYFDRGGASRFFYCAKASRAEREAGLEGLEPRRFAQSSGGKTDAVGGEDDERYGAEHIGLNKVKTVRNHHPTVKPIALMRWLVRLVTPPGGLVLDLFLGSGTTAVACELEGLRWLGVERDPGYAAIAERRIRFWREHGEEGLRVVARREASERLREQAAEAGQLSLLPDAQV